MRVPNKVNIFSGKLMLGLIPTADRLTRIVPHIKQVCPFCTVFNESNEHVFLGCGVIRCVWIILAKTLDISWWDPGTVLELLQGWGHLCPGKAHLKFWLLIPHAALWAIWGERNCRIFKESCHSMSVILKKIVQLVEDWSSYFGLLCSHQLMLFRFRSSSSGLPLSCRVIPGVSLLFLFSFSL